MSIHFLGCRVSGTQKTGLGTSGILETLIWTFCWWLPGTRDVVSGSPYSTHFLAHRNTYHLIDLMPWCRVRDLRQPKSTDSPRPLTSTDKRRCRTTTCPAGPLTCWRFSWSWCCPLSRRRWRWEPGNQWCPIRSPLAKKPLISVPILFTLFTRQAGADKLSLLRANLEIG